MGLGLEQLGCAPEKISMGAISLPSHMEAISVKASALVKDHPALVTSGGSSPVFQLPNVEKPVQANQGTPPSRPARKPAVVPEPIPPMVGPIPEPVYSARPEISNTVITEDGYISKGELFKVYLAIDRQFIKNNPAIFATLNGLGSAEVSQVDDILVSLISGEVTDSDLDDILSSDSLNGLSGVLQKVGSAIKKAGKAVVNTTVKVVKKAAQVVQKIVAAPARALITAAIEIFKSKISSAFIYAFIPDGHALLKNSLIARKRDRQRNFINLLTKAAAFEQGYLMKHIANGFQASHGLSPEQFLDQLAKKTAQLGIVLTLATFAAVTAAMVPLLPFIPDIVKSFKKADVPAPSDTAGGGGSAPAPDDGAWRGDDTTAPEGGDKGDDTDGGDGGDKPDDETGLGPWIKRNTGLAVGIGAGIAAALGVTIYAVTRPKRTRKRRK